MYTIRHSEFYFVIAYLNKSTHIQSLVKINELREHIFSLNAFFISFLKKFKQKAVHYIVTVR